MQTIDASTWLSQAAVEKLGWVLVHSFWQLTAIALLAWLLDRALQRRSSSVRYWSLLVSLLVMMASPVVTWMMLPTSIDDDVAAVSDGNPGPGLMMLETPLPATNREPITPVEEIQNSVAEIQESSAMKSASFSRWMNQCAVFLKPWLGTIVSVWCFGVLLFSARPVVSWVNVQRLKRQGTSAVSESVRQTLTMLAQKLNVRQRVDVMMSTVVSSPIVVGCFRSVILLPASFIAGVPPAQLEAILAHELAHVKRYDFFFNLIQTLVETLFFYHPAVWWLSHRIRIERENCCDDMVVAALNNKVDSGRALLAIEELRGQVSSLALSAKGGSLVARVRRLFYQQPQDRSRTATGVTAVLMLLCCGVIEVTWSAVSANEEPDTTSVPVRGELQNWVDQLVAAQDHRVVAFQIGPELLKLSPEGSLAVVKAAWPKLTRSECRTGVLKAFHFGTHPNILQVLHLGMTDDDAKVADYASNYLTEIALRKFAPRDARYDAWYAEFGDKPLVEVFAAGYRQLAISLRGQTPTVAAQILADTSTNFGLNKNLPTYSQRVDAVVAAGLPELIIDLFEQANGDNETITPFTMALHSMPISRELAESRLKPLLAKDKPVDVRVVAAQTLVATHPNEATEVLFEVVQAAIENPDDSRLMILDQVCTGTIGKIADPRLIPRLIAIMDSDNSPNVRRDINSALCDSEGLGQFTQVEHSSFLDGPWWRKWWVANRERMPEPARSIDIEDLPKTKFGMAYKAQNADTSTHEGRIEVLRQEFAKLGEGSVSTLFWDATTALAEAGDPRAIPVLIGVIEADNSYDTIYGAGYYGLGFAKLGRLVGVDYSKFHDGAWWRRWWEANKQRFPEAQDIPIEEFPKTINGRNHVPFPADLDTHEGRVRFLNVQLKMKQPQAKRSDLADLFSEFDDPRGIPVLIGVIAADDSGKSIYDVGYFGLGMGKLGKLTGVQYHESHDAVWWQAWWATHRHDYPEAANIDIPTFEDGKDIFRNTVELNERLKLAKERAAGENKRIAIVIAKPDSQQADWFYSLLQGTDDDLKRWKVDESAIKEIRQSLPRFQLLWVDAAQFDELRRLIPDHEFEDQHESSMVFLESDGSWLCHFEPDPMKDPRRALENLGSALDLHKEAKK